MNTHAFLLVSFLFVSSTAAAQEAKTTGPAELPIGAELAIIDRTPGGIDIAVIVKRVSNQSEVSNVTALAGADPCPASKDTYAWAVDTTGNFGECNSYLPNPLLLQLPADTLYDFFFDAAGTALSLRFKECVASSVHDFYCPFGDGTDDLRLDLISSGAEITVTADQAGKYGDFATVLGSGDWIMPHHAVAYCEAQSVVSYTACLNETADSYHELGFFASNNVDKSYSLVNADMVVQNDHEWIWADGALSLTFASNTGIKLEALVGSDPGGRLTVTNGVTFNFSESGSSIDDGLSLLGAGTRAILQGVTMNGGDLRLNDQSSVVFGVGTNALSLDSFAIDGDVTIGDGNTVGTATFSFNDFSITSGSSLTIESGQTIEFDGVDLTIPLGATLVLEDNSTLRFGVGKKLIVKGTLVTNGSVNNWALLTASSTTWGGFEYDSGVTSTATGLKIEKVKEIGGNMITVYDGKLILKSSVVDHDTQGTFWGVYSPYNAGDIELEDSYVEAIWGHAVLSQGNDLVRSINTDYFQQGANFGALAAGSGSDVWTWKSEFDGYSGTSHGQALRAIGSGTNIYASSTSGFENDICGDHQYLLWADDNASIFAGLQRWVNSDDYNRTYVGTGASIVTTNPATGAVCSLAAEKRFVEKPAVLVATPDPRGDSISWQLFWAAREARQQGSYSEALNLLKDALAVRDDDAAVRVAMSGLANVFKYTKDATAIGAVAGMRMLPKFAAQATRDLVSMHAREGRINAANRFVTELAQSHPNSPELFDARLTLFYAQRREGAKQLLGSILGVAVPTSQHQEMILVNAYRAVDLDPSYARTFEARHPLSKSVTASDIRVSAHPNPFNPATIITLEIPEANVTTAKVYDILGRRVATLVDDRLGAGVHEFRFDASRLPSGAYFYYVISGQSRITGTLNLIR